MTKSALPIKVSELLASEIGAYRTYQLTDEHLELNDVTLTQPITGDLRLAKIDEGAIATRGQMETAVELECHRCLRSYEHQVSVRIEQVYRQQPGEDELPIRQYTIDLAPSLEQEILLSLPIKLLCRDDCPGIEDAITKGSSHGST